MRHPVRILGIGGSMAAESSSRRALDEVLKGAQAVGSHVTTARIDVRELALPMYDPDQRDLEVLPEGVQRLITEVRRADALVWATPLYHGALSGAFKNALDWLQLLAGDERVYLTGMPVALVSTAAGVQGIQAINQMENVVRALRGYTVPFVIAVPQAYKAFPDVTLEKQLQKLGVETVWAAERLTRAPEIVDELTIATVPA